MKKSANLLLGIATIWPFVYMIFFFAAMVYLLFLTPQDGSSGGFVPIPFRIFVPLHLLSILSAMALSVFYMVNVFKNNRVDKDKKVLWAVVLFLGNMIAMPIYWYLYIWRDETRPSPAQGDDDRAFISADVSTRPNTRTSSESERQYIPPPQPPNWRD